MAKLKIDTLTNSSKANLLEYLYLLQSEFQEINSLIQSLKNYRKYKLDVREATNIQNALNIAVNISYTRNFKRSYGFKSQQEVNSILIQDFTKLQLELHNKLKDLRDQEFAHSDASSNDIQLYENGMFTHSRKVVRNLLRKYELNKLSQMVAKISKQIDAQINILN